ncbi:hypothetical protein BUALT_Bualt17G0098200 [Buddleja alternifolia]|uniref:Uncharacterized protein n=1 Tax=Buddleja alternifolia TaxID=168488 RepID=A0AAV6WHZ7_9LAMI|nr:hypothetical protein BUALT_Bualt17G0098200 [Buddleja alternifolia]
MSFSGEKRPFYPSPLVLLLIISLLHIRVPSQSKAVAIRIIPRSLGALEEPPPPPGKINQTKIFKEYFNGRISDLNSTTTSTNGTFLDYKRRIPSCPDALHN